MNNNEIMKYKENIFRKILNKFKLLFSKKVNDNCEKTDNFENVAIKSTDLEMIRLKGQIENKKIDIRKLTNEQIGKLIKMYKKEIEQQIIMIEDLDNKLKD